MARIKTSVKDYEGALISADRPFPSSRGMMRWANNVPLSLAPSSLGDVEAGGRALRNGNLGSYGFGASNEGFGSFGYPNETYALREANRALNRRRFNARLTGLGDDGILAPVTAGLAAAQAKGDKLETAIKAILVLSGIAALTGVVNLMK